MMERKRKHRSVVDDDMISKLPDPLISQILSYLPTKEALRTCVLSHRWKSLGLLIPCLDLVSYQFPDYNTFMTFINKFLDFSKVHNSCLHKLKLSIHDDARDESSLTHWIDFVSTPKLKFLDVERRVVERDCLKVMPLSLYVCETLLYLRLHRVVLSKFEFVSLPCLKTMSLEQNVYADESVLEKLIASCPVLEDLRIARMFDENVKVLRVRSKTLTSLSIKHYFGADVARLSFPNDFRPEELEVLIDAPRLEYLSFEDELSKSKTIGKLSSLTKVSLLGGFYLWDSEGTAFFTSILGVKDMKISSEALKFIQGIMPLPPRFCNLSSLEAKLRLVELGTLPKFLESCPNLRSLILDLHDTDSVNELTSLASVPQCLLSSLEYVEMKSRSMFCPHPREMEVARYFIENSMILKKLVLLMRSSIQDEESLVALRELILAFPRRSSTCQIVLC